MGRKARRFKSSFCSSKYLLTRHVTNAERPYIGEATESGRGFDYTFPCRVFDIRHHVELGTLTSETQRQKLRVSAPDGNEGLLAIFAYVEK